MLVARCRRRDPRHVASGCLLRLEPGSGLPKNLLRRGQDLDPVGLISEPRLQDEVPKRCLLVPRPVREVARLDGAVEGQFVFMQVHLAADLLGQTRRPHGGLGPQPPHEFVAQGRRLVLLGELSPQFLVAGGQDAVGPLAPARGLDLIKLASSSRASSR